VLEKRDEEYQQRRIALYCGEVSEHDSAFGTANQKKSAGATRKLPRDRNAACMMAIRKRTAARDAWSAVTGPFTTEYGPCTDGKRRIVRTQKTATIASSHPTRPDIIDVWLLYSEVRIRGVTEGQAISISAFDFCDSLKFRIVLDQCFRGTDFFPVQQVP
jgi:hypothetical protein